MTREGSGRVGRTLAWRHNWRLSSAKTWSDLRIDMLEKGRLDLIRCRDWSGVIEEGRRRLDKTNRFDLSAGRSSLTPISLADLPLSTWIMDEESQSCGRSWWSSPSPLDFMYGFATGVLDRDFDSDRFLDDCTHGNVTRRRQTVPRMQYKMGSLLIYKLQERHAPSYSWSSQQFVEDLEAACNATPLACPLRVQY